MEDVNTYCGLDPNSTTTTSKSDDEWSAYDFDNEDPIES